MLELPMQLRVGGCTVLLVPETRLYPHHTEPGRGYDFTAATAAMMRNPDQEGEWALHNLTERIWCVTFPDGSTQVVEPQQSVAPTLGTLIDFGARRGEIVAA
jgi:hypothetical protein